MSKLPVVARIAVILSALPLILGKVQVNGMTAPSWDPTDLVGMVGGVSWYASQDLINELGLYL